MVPEEFLVTQLHLKLTHVMSPKAFLIFPREEVNAFAKSASLSLKEPTI
jgi:hypothetical protein